MKLEQKPKAGSCPFSFTPGCSADLLTFERLVHLPTRILSLKHWPSFWKKNDSWIGLIKSHYDIISAAVFGLPFSSSPWTLHSPEICPSWLKYILLPSPLSLLGLPWCPCGKESACNAGDARDEGSIPGSGRSPGGGEGNPLQYYCLENSLDREVWWNTVHRVTKSRIPTEYIHTHAHTHTHPCTGCSFWREHTSPLTFRVPAYSGLVSRHSLSSLGILPWAPGLAASTAAFRPLSLKAWFLNQ